MERFIKQHIDIKASVSGVWQILTKAEYTRQYMYGCNIESSFEINSPMLWRGHTDGIVYVKGALLELLEHEKLVYTVFDPNGNYEDVPTNYLVVTYTLKEQEQGMLLEVTQGDYSKVFDGKKRYEDTIAQGGWQSVLEGIKKIAEADFPLSE